MTGYVVVEVKGSVLIDAYAADGVTGCASRDGGDVPVEISGATVHRVLVWCDALELFA